MLIKEKAKCFGGTVYEAPVSKLEEVFFDSELKFSDSGKSWLLHASKTPESYFSKQPTSLQRDLLSSMKTEIKQDSLLLLKSDGEDGMIDYVCLDKEQDLTDPVSIFDEALAGLDDAYLLRRKSLSSGAVQYIFRQDTIEKDEYVPALYLDVPMLYNGDLKLELGFYKVRCSNGMMDSVNSSSISMKPEQFSPDIFKALATGVFNALHSNFGKYQEFFNFLKNVEITPDHALEVLKGMYEAKTVSGHLGSMCNKYFSLVKSGREVDPLLPTEFKTYYHFMDVLTYYSQKLGFSGQKKMERNTFKFLYKMYLDECKASKIPEVSLKEIASLEKMFQMS